MSADTESRIRTLLDKVTSEQNIDNCAFEIKLISSGGANYTSKLYLAKVTSNTKDLHLFIKVAVMPEKVAADMKIYDIEHFVYTELSAAYHRLEARSRVPAAQRLTLPRYFGADMTPGKQLLVLEDLTARGFTTHDRFRSVDWPYAAAAFSSLAKIHSLSMAYQHASPADFNSVVNFFKKSEQEGNDLDIFWKTSIKTSLAVVREENRERFEKFLNGADPSSFFFSNASGKSTVLVHSDFRPSNLMHRTLDDGSIEVIPVDYQTMQGGSPVNDLLYFIISGTDAQFREKHYEQLIEHYYSELAAALARLGLDPDKVYSRNAFKGELKEKQLFGLIVAVFLLPIITVEAENIPKVGEDTLLSDLSVQNTGSLFPERLNGVVDDYVRWGLI